MVTHALLKYFQSSCHESNDMILPLHEKSFRLVEKSHPMNSNLWFLQQTVSRLLLLCRPICWLPRFKLFQQNGGVTGGHRMKPIK